VIVLKKRKLGDSDLVVSEIGFGSMSLPLDEKESTYMIHKALDSGINFIDTADLYEFGEVEKLVGSALKGKRKEVILATKVGNRWDRVESGWEWDPSKEYIKKEIQQSLKRLNTDYIDLYQLHGGTIEDNFEEIIEAFEELKKEGYIRYYGISSIRPNVIKKVLQHSNITSIMMQYSLLDRRPEEFLDLIQNYNVSVIARGPIAKGWLSERVYERGSDENYLSYTLSEVITVVERLQAFADKRDCSISQLALHYPLHHPSVATVIPGASKIEQLVKNIEAGNIDSLTTKEIEQLQTITKNEKYEQHR
jgi:aryl-alcohol dehydrogenase-like predicted oxidoreductase